MRGVRMEGVKDLMSLPSDYEKNLVFMMAKAHIMWSTLVTRKRTCRRCWHYGSSHEGINLSQGKMAVQARLKHRLSIYHLQRKS